MKVIIVGGVAGGATAAARLRRLDETAEIVVFERSGYVSYANCGLPYYIGGVITDKEELTLQTPESFWRRFRVDMRVRHEVTAIHPAEKTVDVRNLATGETFTESYDKLILAAGSLPIIPKIEGLELENVDVVKLFQDGQKIDKTLDDPTVKNVAVVGAGYIGVEIAEAVQRRGKSVRLFEALDTTLAGYYDPWFSHDMDEVLAKNGVELHFGETVKELKGQDGKVCALVTDKGQYDAELVILAIGFVPNNKLAGDKLEQFRNGAILVDSHQQTSLPDVYAIGDCATVYSNALRSPAYIALATNAVRSGIVAAHNACGTALESIGVQGSNGISIYGYKMVSTGLNLKAAERAGMEVAYTDYEDLQKPGFIKENHPVKIRIIYEKSSRRVVGAQMASYEDISMGIHMFSLAIEEGVTIDKLKLLDIFFLPHFNQPYNYITMAALGAK